MLSFSSAVRVFVFQGECDMRSSFSRLTSLVKNEIKEVSHSGHLFLFLNRTRTSVKILYFDRTGYVIWYKRLESGTFSRPEKGEIDYRLMMCILEGIEDSKITKKKRFSLGNNQFL
jgi:transposase